MISKWRDQALTLKVGLICINKWRKNAFFQRIIYSGRKHLHVLMSQASVLFPLRIVCLVVNSGKGSSKSLEIFIGNIAVTDTFQQFFQRDCFCSRFVSGYRSRLFVFRHAYGIYQIEAILAEGIWCDVAKLLITNSAHTTSFHLDIQWFRLHIAHEHDHLQWLDIRSCCD